MAADTDVGCFRVPVAGVAARPAFVRAATHGAQAKQASDQSAKEQKPVRGVKDLADGKIKTNTCKGPHRVVTASSSVPA